MPRPRLSFGETLAAAAGGALLLLTFLPWFEQTSSGGIAGGGAPTVDRTLNAWSASVVLTILIALAAAVPLWQVARRLRSNVPPYPQFLLGAGALAVALVLFVAALKFGDTGAAGVGAVRTSTDAQPAFVLSLVAALLIATGGVLAMWRPRPTLEARRRR